MQNLKKQEQTKTTHLVEEEKNGGGRIETSSAQRHKVVSGEYRETPDVHVSGIFLHLNCFSFAVIHVLLLLFTTHIFIMK